MTAKRIQRKRTKGWKMPENTIYAGRPSLLSNPFRIEDWGRDGAVAAFRLYVKHHHAGKALATFVEAMLRDKGKNIACWCHLCERHKNGKTFGEVCSDCDPCHTDVLGEIANADEGPTA